MSAAFESMLAAVNQPDPKGPRKGGGRSGQNTARSMASVETAESETQTTILLDDEDGSNIRAFKGEAPMQRQLYRHDSMEQNLVTAELHATESSQQLCELGFDEKRVVAAVAASGGDLAKATTMLFDDGIQTVPLCACPHLHNVLMPFASQVVYNAICTAQADTGAPPEVCGDCAVNPLETGIGCSNCGHQETSVCLGCGEVLCGRHARGHMLQHCDKTGHSVVMMLSDLSVWCVQPVQHPRLSCTGLQVLRMRCVPRFLQGCRCSHQLAVAD